VPGEDPRVPVLGQLPPRELVRKLRSLGETDTALALELALIDTIQGTPTTFSQEGRQAVEYRGWWHRAHLFGYFLPGSVRDPCIIHPAEGIAPDVSLQGARIAVRLHDLRISDYPGGEVHRVLFEFAALNHLRGEPELLRFNMTCRLREGDQAPIAGRPVFVGLTVGSEGLDFQCRTVKVADPDDESFLGFLESGPFLAGLRASTVRQPAAALYADTTFHLTERIAAAERNTPVQAFQLGLGFGTSGVGARLAEGSYVAVQAPEGIRAGWYWEEWVYDPVRQRIVAADDPDESIGYNYLVFSVSRTTYGVRKAR
jgi:hypothetical protein